MRRDSRTTIIGILVLAERALTAAELIRLAKPLGLSRSNVKSHLTRMVGNGSLRRRGPVRGATYELSSRQGVIVAGIKARLSERSHMRWDGTWYLLTFRLLKSRSGREQLRASLWFDGFRPVSPCTYMRPVWPLPWAWERVQRYLAEGVEFCVRGKLIAGICAPEELYDLIGLDAEGRRLAAWLRQRKWRASSPPAAFVARMDAGARVARLIGHDPRLPQVMWGKRQGMFDAVRAFHEFEEQAAPKAQLFMEHEMARGTKSRKGRKAK
jgi:DNA-binding transcriptional regulator PaaX